MKAIVRRIAIAGVITMVPFAVSNASQAARAATVTPFCTNAGILEQHQGLFRQELWGQGCSQGTLVWADIGLKSGDPSKNIPGKAILQVGPSSTGPWSNIEEADGNVPPDDVTTSVVSSFR